MYAQYKFRNLSLMRGNVISCSSGEICCGSRLAASTDLQRALYPLILPILLSLYSTS